MVSSRATTSMYRWAHGRVDLTGDGRQVLFDLRQRLVAGRQRAGAPTPTRTSSGSGLSRGYLAPGMSGSRTRTRSSCMPWSTPQRTARERLSTLILR